jgi:hypothetical protein
MAEASREVYDEGNCRTAPDNMVFTMQQGTTQSQAARERISTTKALKAEIARKALVLKADPTNVEKQVDLAEALEEFEKHKNTLDGAYEAVLKAGPANAQQLSAFAACMFLPGDGPNGPGSHPFDKAKGETFDAKFARIYEKARQRVHEGDGGSE